MIISKIQEVAHKFPDKIAIIFDQHQITYAQFEEITNKLANGFTIRGIQAGDRVALMMPNLPHCIFSYYAILKAGGIVVPINYMMEDDEFKGVLANIQPQSIIYWEGFRKYVQDYVGVLEEKPNLIVLGKKRSIDQDSLLELISNSKPEFEPVQRAAEDTAVIQFTSGVTEPPKGIEFSYENLSSSIEGTAKFFRFNEMDTFGAVLPLFFIFSQNVMVNGALSRGGTVVLFSKVDYSKILQSIDSHKISVLAGSPNFYRLLIDSAHEMSPGSSLKYCLVSWHQLPAELSSKFEQKSGIPLLNCYSITETGGLVAANHHTFDIKSGSVGLRLPDVDIQIHDEHGHQLDHHEVGEIAIQGKMVMKNYWNCPELTAIRLRNGWYYTGDMGKIDEQGNIFLVNKKAEVITKSGFPIYTNEIEQILTTHPKVKEAVAIAIPHPDHKEDVQACVVLKENETATAEEIFEYCRSQVPVYKCPQIVKFYPSLPRTKMGRIFKRKLQENSIV